MRRKVRRNGFAAIGFLVAVAIGCGGSDKPVEEVTGTVTYQGRGVPEASVMFAPQGTAENAEPGKPAAGVTDAEGRYSLTTYDPEDGAVVGAHRVEVGALDPDKPLPGKFAGPTEVTVGSGENVFDFELK